MLIDASHRRWAVGCGIAAVIAAVVYVSYHRSALNGPSGGSALGLTFGVVGFALMIVAGLLGARKAVPAWRIGRASTWVKGHVWLSLLSVPLILFHAGFRMTGALTITLTVLLGLVVVSGIVGLAFQQFLPRLIMKRVPQETVYEQIDSVVNQLRDEADGLVAVASGEDVIPSRQPANGERGPGTRRPQPTPRPRAAVASAVAESAPLREVYATRVRPFLDPRQRRHSLNDAEEAASVFRLMRTLLPGGLHDTVAELEAIVEERRQLATQKRLHHWLHGWLLVHVPLSMALLLLAIVHAIMSVRY